MGKRKKQDKFGSVSDPRLIPRVKQYLESHQNKKMIDISVMAQNLQKIYSDYGRKKRIPFEHSVESVVKLLNRRSGRDYTSKLEMKHLQQQRKNLGDNGVPSTDVSRNHSRNASDITSGSESDTEPSDVELVTYPDTNLMNQSLHSLYKETTSAKFTAKELDTEKQPESAGFFVDTVGDVANTDTPHAKCVTNKDMQSLSKLPARKNFAMSKRRKLPDSALQKIKKRKTEDSDSEAKNRKDIFQKSDVTFADIGGNDKILQDVCKLLIHMKHPQVFEKLGVDPPRGILLHGPPGCGKTLLAHGIAGELNLPFIKTAATEMVSGVSGESEERIRDMFEKAVMNSPCILFIDEIDAITPKRETASKEMERRIVAQLLACMDDLNTRQTSQVLILGATNRPDSLDPALRRAGRFDRELCMGIPDATARTRILMVLCRNLRLSTGFDFEELARKTPGYVGADLMALCREAAASAVDRVFTKLEHEVGETNAGPNCDVIPLDVPLNKTANLLSRENAHEQSIALESALKWLKEQPPFTELQLESIYIELSDFEVALSVVQPSAKREGFATVPDVSWDDVGALADVREELSLAILAPVRYPKQFKAMGLNNPPGILLFGPPGCGKTLLAKAIANESGINFISVKGPELLNMYVGESEKAVRQCFQRARNSAPCVIFFDELDALCPRRSSTSDSGASVRVVNQLLTEMDGLEARKQVFIMGATNRPDIIDPAILRPGRLDKTLYVGLPSPSGRFEILKTITKNGMKPPVADDVNLESLAFDGKCEGYTGADLAALVHEAAIVALKELIGQSFAEGVHNTSFNDNSQVTVADKHFQAALKKIKPSVNKVDQQRYEDYLAIMHKL